MNWWFETYYFFRFILYVFAQLSVLGQYRQCQPQFYLVSESVRKLQLFFNFPLFFARECDLVWSRCLKNIQSPNAHT